MYVQINWEKWDLMQIAMMDWKLTLSNVRLYENLKNIHVHVCSDQNNKLKQQNCNKKGLNH